MAMWTEGEAAERPEDGGGELQGFRERERDRDGAVEGKRTVRKQRVAERIGPVKDKGFFLFISFFPIKFYYLVFFFCLKMLGADRSELLCQCSILYLI